MISTISGRMLVFFAAFMLLLAGVMGATLSVLSRQADDALIVNLAGRQRMLTQMMAKESLQLANYAFTDETDEIEAKHNQLSRTMQVFETTLFALRDGGSAPTDLAMTRFRESPAAATEAIRQQLDDVAAKWSHFERHLEAILESDGRSTAALESVARAAGPLLESMNTATDLMQADAERKVRVLYIVQGAALVLGILLGLSGAWVARKTIAKPVMRLAEAARLISTGNLNVEVRASGTREITDLCESFDRMRVSMLATLESQHPGRAAGADDDF